MSNAHVPLEKSPSTDSLGSTDTPMRLTDSNGYRCRAGCLVVRVGAAGVNSLSSASSAASIVTLAEGASSPSGMAAASSITTEVDYAHITRGFASSSLSLTAPLDGASASTGVVTATAAANTARASTASIEASHGNSSSSDGIAPILSASAGSTASSPTPSSISSSSSTSSFISTSASIIESESYSASIFRLNAACAILAQKYPDYQVLLVSSRNKAGKWSLPAGGMEPGELPAAAASRETLEEAGVAGPVTFLTTATCTLSRATTQVHLMRAAVVEEDWLEAGFRVRQWFSFESLPSAIVKSGTKDFHHATYVLSVALEALTRTASPL